jgi:methionyl-tRNA formyltransferase
LDQTPAPGIDIPNPETCTVPELLDLMSRKSAEMLVKGIRERIFVPPLTDAGWREAEGVDDLIHATKIKTEDRHVDWQHWTWMDISRRLRVLGPLWSIALVPVKSSDGGFTFQKKRIILSKIEEAPKHVQGSEKMALVPGVPFVPMRVPEFSSQDDEALFSYTADGRLLRLREIKVEGQVFKNGLAAARKAHMLSDRSVRLGDAEFSLFHNPLF